MSTRSPTRPCVRPLKKNALKPHRRKMWCIPDKPSAEFVYHMEDVLEVYHRPYDPKRPVVCVDETSYEDGCVKPVLLSAGRHRPFLRVLASVGAEVELRAARGALANLVSGGTGSAPRSLIRVGGAPRRAAPLFISGAVRQPTSRPGHRSLGPTGPVSPSGSGPICRSAFTGAPPAHIPPLIPLSASPVRPASAPSPAGWCRPGGIARARSGAYAPEPRS